MPIVRLCLELVDYINIRLLDENITKRESNSLKLLKGVICDYVISQIQRRKESANVTDGTEPCINYDTYNCEQSC